MADKIPFPTVIKALTNPDANFPGRLLPEFSDLPAPDLALLTQAWPQVPVNRKRTLLRDLNERFRDDSLVSFHEVAKLFIEDADPQVRAQAVRLLEETNDVRLLPRLIELGEHDPDVGVRTETATVLGEFVQLGELEALSAERKEQVEAVLLKDARESNNTHLQRAALESLGYSSRPEVVDLIENAFERPDPLWTASALLAMSRSADTRWQDQVLISLSHEDTQVRLVAVQAAGELELKAARQMLLGMLEEEEDDEVLEAVIWSLSQIGGEDVRTYLQAMLDAAEDEDQVGFLEDALTNLSFTEDMEGFDLMAYDPDDDLEDLDEIDESDDGQRD